MDQAQSLFDTIRRKKLAYIQDLVPASQEETHWLDFKANPDASSSAPDKQRLDDTAGRLTKKGKRILAEAVSGYANADGGVIIWGVVCQKQDGIDVATELRPVSNLRKLAADLRLQSSQVVSPPVDGVEHYPIWESKADDRGFVATYVPRDGERLHMSTAADQHTFYKRAGEMFIPMAEYEIAAGYARKPAPNLALAWEFRVDQTDAESIRIGVRLGIQNLGRAIAHHPALAIYNSGAVDLATTHSPLGGPGRGLKYLSVVQRSRVIDGVQAEVRFFAGEPDILVYPGMTLWVAITTPIRFPRDAFVNASMMVTYELFADGFYQEGATQISSEQFQKYWNEARRTH